MQEQHADTDHERFRAEVFKYRGALLSVPALVLAVLGKPSAFSVTLGLPLAFAGELFRCWAVGYSGVTTRGDHVEAPRLTTNGPYAYLRNPLYVGNALTALGFSLAFTGRMAPASRAALIAAGLTVMGAVYSVIVPHEEAFLEKEFGDDFRRYCDAVPRVFPRLSPYRAAHGSYDSSVIAKAETRTFITFGIMLAALAFKAKHEST